MPKSPLETLEQADVVFAGRVTSVSSNPFTWTKTVNFLVSKIWKGTERKYITVTTANHAVSCGADLKLNKEYIVYAYSIEDTLTTNSCSRTKPLSSAEEDLAGFGQGSLPTDYSVDLSIPITTYFIWGGILIIVIVLISVKKKK